MAKEHRGKGPSSRRRRRTGKVGSDPEAARSIGGEGDFGAPESNPVERAYASRETKRRDPGAAPSRSTADGRRDSGAGSPQSGPGSGSGGDLDPDIVGVGFGGSGVAQTGPTRTQGADITTGGGSEPFAAPGPKGRPAKPPTHRQIVRGSTMDHSGGDITTTGEGLESGSVANPQARDDDSFAADINEDEARGGDNSSSDNK